MNKVHQDQNSSFRDLHVAIAKDRARHQDEESITEPLQEGGATTMSPHLVVAGIGVAFILMLVFVLLI